MKTRAPILLVLLVAVTTLMVQATAALADQDGTKNKALSAATAPAPPAKVAARPAAESTVTPAAMKQTTPRTHVEKASLPAPKAATPKTPANMTWQGELIDEACYSKTGAKGDAHAECGAKCARGGSPVGLLDAKGKVFTILAPSTALADQMGHVVRIRGKMDSRMSGILPEKIEVKSGTEWQAVTLPATP